MLELSQDSSGWRLGYGGDTLNTAIHLARAGVDTAYLTALGSDPFSDDMKRQWTAEGLDTTLVLTNSARNPGLYAITNDEAGERSFTYWRGESAARGLFACAGIEEALDKATQADLLGFSLITLAIICLMTRASNSSRSLPKFSPMAARWRLTAITVRASGSVQQTPAQHAMPPLRARTSACPRWRMRRCSLASAMQTRSPRIGPVLVAQKPSSSLVLLDAACPMASSCRHQRCSRPSIQAGLATPLTAATSPPGCAVRAPLKRRWKAINWLAGA